MMEAWNKRELGALPAPKIFVLTVAIFAFLAEVSNAQHAPTPNGLSVLPIPAYDKVLVGVGVTHLALEKEFVRSFLDAAPQYRVMIGGETHVLSFVEFLSDTSRIVEFLPVMYGGMRGVLSPGTLSFSRATPSAVVIYISNGAGERSIEIPIAEARVFGEMLEEALRELGPDGEATTRVPDIRS